MEIKIYTVSVFHGAEANEEMNLFLRTHKVIEIDKRFVSNENGAYWSFCLSYIRGGKVDVPYGSRDRKKRKDYRELLDAATFATFDRLRKYRKEIAKNDAVPAFAVFTDAELILMAKLPEITLSNVQSIKGIGVKKMEKYGELTIKMYQKDETNRKPD